MTHSRQNTLVVPAAFCVVYFSSILLLALTPNLAGQSGEALQSLEPITEFARVSNAPEADDANYLMTSSFLSNDFSAEDNALEFVLGVDAPPQPLRGHPQDVAVSHDGRRVYVSLPGNEAEPLDQVSVVDPDRGQVVDQIEVGLGPYGLLMHPQQNILIVGHLYSNGISIVSTTTNEVLSTEVLETPSGSRYYSQEMAWWRGGEYLLVLNRMTDSLLMYRYSNYRIYFVAEVPLRVTNMPIDTSTEPLHGPFNISSDADHLPPATQGLTNNSNPRGLTRVLKNTNPIDLAVVQDVWVGGKLRLTDLAYVANVNGLGISIVDLKAKKLLGSIDLNSPVLGIESYSSPLVDGRPARRYVFASTGSRFANAFEDVTSELVVVSVDEDPLVLETRYTAAKGLPAGPSGGPATGKLVSPGGTAPYLSAFATPTAARQNLDNNSSRDLLPELLSGALPSQMAVSDSFLALTYAASDQLEFFSINPAARTPADVLLRKSLVFTNSDQVSAPTAQLQALLTNQFNANGQLEYDIFENGSLESGGVLEADPITGTDVPGFFNGRMPAGVAIHSETRRIYVANRLGESLAVFEYSPDGNVNPGRIPAIDLRVGSGNNKSPQFPATLAELGEDFYTSSRVSLNRRQSCLACHPNINTDSKVWAVSAAPGNARRRVLSNRNLRGTAPYGFAGSRSNLEIDARNLRSFVPDVFFGSSLEPVHHAFRDANKDGLKNEHDRGRTQADLNRDAMFVLERTGIGFEYVAAAIAAFMEAEPRLVPNPFRTREGNLSAQVPMNSGQDRIVLGDARRGAALFRDNGCISCHPPPLYTTNQTFTRKSQGTALDLTDMNGNGILDGVVLSHEESVFGPGSIRDWVDPRLLPLEDRSASQPLTGYSAYPLERARENAIDQEPEVFVASGLNFSTFDFDFPSQLPCSRFSSTSTLEFCEGSGRLLADEPGYMVDPEVRETGSDGRNVNVPSLRNAWELGSYLHHGRAASILEVLTSDAEYNFSRDVTTGAVASGPHIRHGNLDGLQVDIDLMTDLAAFVMSIE